MKERCAQSSWQQHKLRLLNGEEMEQGSYLLQLGLSLVRKGIWQLDLVYSLLEWGVLRRTAGAMSTGIIILFAAVGVCWVGASEMTSVVGLESARVGVFCGSGDIATTPNGLFDLSGATTFSKYFACAPPRSAIALFLLNVWYTRTTFEWINMVWWQMEYVLKMDRQGVFTYTMCKLS